jgi:hypothetical protein
MPESFSRDGGFSVLVVEGEADRLCRVIEWASVQDDEIKLDMRRVEQIDRTGPVRGVNEQGP